MDHPPAHQGPIAVVINLASTFLAFISIKDAQIIISIGAGLTSMATGFFAIRYYRKKTNNP